jgi:hypothetical protein
MLRAAGFAAVAILTLALGIGANTAVFSVLDSVVLSPLPWRDPGELVRLYTATRQDPDQRQFLPGLDIIDVRREVDAFASVGIMYSYREDGADLRAPDGHAERIRVLRVSADYFRTLGATPLLGRTFVQDEERANAHLVVLSHALWSSYTGRDTSVIGRTVELNGVHREVVGVMRPTFRDLVAPDVAAWIPQDLTPGGSNSRGNYYLSAVARLAPGLTVGESQARVDAFMRRLDEQYPQDEPRIMRVLPLHDDIVGETSLAIYLLMGAAGLVLLIACSTWRTSSSRGGSRARLPCGARWERDARAVASGFTGLPAASPAAWWEPRRRTWACARCSP